MSAENVPAAQTPQKHTTHRTKERVTRKLTTNTPAQRQDTGMSVRAQKLDRQRMLESRHTIVRKRHGSIHDTQDDLKSN